MLRENWPNIIVTHCLAHRLELAFKDAVKKSASTNVYDRTLTLLMGLYYFYRKSPKQKKHLMATFALNGMKSILPTRIGGTRWLPHTNRAVHAFIKGYKAFVYQLQNASHNNPKAEGFAKLAVDGGVIIFLLHLKVTIDSNTYHVYENIIGI